MLTDPLFYLCAVPAVVLLGLGKGGLAGFGTLAVPLLSMVVSPLTAAGILLPILLVQDVVGVAAFRKSFDGKILALMLPGAVVGIAIAWFLAHRVSADWITLLLGLLSVLFAAQRLWVERGGRVVAPSNAPAWFGVLCGVGSGFTSQVSHSGGPPFQLYVLPKMLPRDCLIGTTAIFFCAVNWMKMPAYAALGQFTSVNLLVSAVLTPLAIVSTMAGVWLVRRIDGARLYTIIYALLFLLGIKLVFDGAGALLG